MYRQKHFVIIPKKLTRLVTISVTNTTKEDKMKMDVTLHKVSHSKKKEIFKKIKDEWNLLLPHDFCF